MAIKRKRIVEAQKIHKVNRAAAVGKLMLGEISNWHEFLSVETADYESLPRRQLKSGVKDIQNRLSQEIHKFCQSNFEKMDIDMLSRLYEEIKTHRGLEITCNEFEQKYSKFRKHVLNGMPVHSTVVFCLSGMKFKFPEDYLTKDLLCSLKGIMLTKDKKDKTGEDIRSEEFYFRSSVITSFNLLEAYLNGISWDFLYKTPPKDLSGKKRKLLEGFQGISIREKLKKYPTIITGEYLFEDKDLDVVTLLDIMKPFRDALVHPSPFTMPEKFGGHNKSDLFYRVNRETALLVSQLTCKIIKRINSHIGADTRPVWLAELDDYMTDLKEGNKEHTVKE
ncbi:hypothetical protein [Maridesulfovibrio sp.]|uniref:hypothetical protein n=1 Tax=Maridesulfovibrio sp. TaxID=2795000 RepID=UPI003BA9F494